MATIGDSSQIQPSSSRPQSPQQQNPSDEARVLKNIYILFTLYNMISLTKLFYKVSSDKPKTNCRGV